MGGLRALCCSKGDRNDDTQNTPVRLAQPPPEKTTQNVPTSEKKEASSTDVTVTPEKPTPNEPAQLSEPPIQETPAPRDLWKEAFEGLDPSDRSHIAADGVPVTMAIDQVMKDTTAKYEQWKKGGLKIHQKNGNEINIRDRAEGILNAAMKAGDIISTAVSFDPTGHASTAWTVISFGMSIVQNRLDRRDAIFAASEYLAEKLSYYTLIDIKYRNQKVETDHNLDQALLNVYSAILQYTIEVKKGRDEGEAKRTFQSVLALTDQPLSQLQTAIETQGVVAEKWATLAANLGDRERAAEHLLKTDAVLENLKKLAAKTLNAEQEAQLAWISSAPYSVPQKDLQKKRTGDTGLWLLDSPEYNQWKTTAGSLLWLPGISGCGKSVLCSSIIQDIQEDCSLDPAKILGYWYFKFGIEATQSMDAMARSLIRQLSRSHLASKVTELYETHHRTGSEPDTKSITGVLDAVLSDLTGDVYLVFDALDECPEDGDRSLVIDLLKDLLKQHSTELRMHILITSRPVQDIQDGLEQFAKIDLEARLADDVKKFVTSRLAQPRLKRWDPTIHDLIIDQLLTSKERRFQWAELQIQALEFCRTEDDIKDALSKVPQTLEDTYQAVLEKIDSRDVEWARKILITICLSPLLFDVETVVSMVGLRFPDDLVRICTTSLINVSDEKVQLSHFSVQEFLVILKDGVKHHECRFSAVNGHKYLTEKTVDILLGQTEVLHQETAKDKVSFLYAAKHWNFHMTAAGGFDELEPELQAKITQLFTESNVYWNWVRAADSGGQNSDNEWSKLLEECQPPIYRACMLGLLQPVNCLRAQGANPLEMIQPSSGGSATSPLAIALENGHFHILEDFLEKGLPLGQYNAIMTLLFLDHAKLGEAKVASIFKRLWDLDLLRKNPSDTSNEIHEQAFLSAAMNPKSGLELTRMILDWQPKITVSISDELLMYMTAGKHDVLGLLLDRCDFEISSSFLEDLESNADSEDGFPAGIAILATKRPHEVPLTDALCEALAEWLGLEEMKSMMQVRKSDFSVTENVMDSASRNVKTGGMFRLLWPDRKPGVAITGYMLICVLSNKHHSMELLDFVQEHISPDLELSEDQVNNIVSAPENPPKNTPLGLNLVLKIVPVLSMTERLVANICRQKDAVYMLDLLVNKGYDLTITDWVMKSTAWNEFRGEGIAAIQYLEKLHPEPLPFTDSAFIAAIENSEQGKEILPYLLQRLPASLLTDRVFEEACKNAGALKLLLDRQQNNLPIGSMLLKLPCSRKSGDVLQVLLDRNLVNVDESTVEALAPNFYALDALLSWKPDAPITEKALIAGTKDDRSMRVLLEVQGSTVHITDAVLDAALQSFRDVSTLQVIQHRLESFEVNEKMLKAALKKQTKYSGSVLIDYLVEQSSESLLRDFLLGDTWQDEDLWSDIPRCSFLIGFSRKTVLRINSSLSEDLPFDIKNDTAYRITDVVPRLYEGHELSGISATELAAVYLVENCYNETIEEYWKDSQFSVTDLVIQGIEKNRVADKGALKLFLEQNRG